jgi:hypothetical protein
MSSRIGKNGKHFSLLHQHVVVSVRNFSLDDFPSGPTNETCKDVSPRVSLDVLAPELANETC